MSEIIRKTEEFFKGAFDDMKESAKAQHEIDKTNFEAVKMQSKANFAEVKVTPAKMRKKMEDERQEKLERAKEALVEAQKQYEEVTKK